MPYQSRAAVILADWRAAERRLLEHDLEPSEREGIEAEIAEFREAYQRLIEEARKASAPEPPPLPTEL